MSTSTLTNDSFMETIEGDGIVLVDFWASWCGPCRQFGPVFEAASEEHEDITFAKVDTEAEQELAAGLAITSIPTLMAFRDGICLFNQAGALPAPSLEQLITAVREVDMEHVRSEVEKAQAEEQAAQDGDTPPA